MRIRWMHGSVRSWHPWFYLPEWSRFYWLTWRYGLWRFVHEGRCYGMEWRRLSVTWGRRQDPQL